MNLRAHLLRSNRYRELGMFDESILELEEIEGEDRFFLPSPSLYTIKKS